jgi:UDP-N-acetylmuramoyl-L-alanyl-D-glutamate--2,6-diaminopimelate ligase
MIGLNSLLRPLDILQVAGDRDVSVSTICFDSRKATSQSLFVAARGTQVDGHQFIAEVIEKGCTVIVCEELPHHLLDEVTYVKVKNASQALALMASVYYGEPSKELELVAVTGTNGKTSVATLLYKLFREFGHHVGLLSTVNNIINDEIIPSTHTTPDALAINELLAKMVDAGCTYCFMEASSHAIHQNRVAGLEFAGVVFTNITHDHLDYHKTFEHYLKAKKKLFDDVNETAFALTNKDDKNGLVMLQNTKGTRYSYGLQSMADFKGKIMESDFSGMLLEVDGEQVWFKLVGRFNAYNLLAAYGTAFLLGKDKADILRFLSKLSSAKGRFDTVYSSDKITGIIDYAHTPDALQNVLQTVADLRTGNEQVITIVGCGGNRDATKRPLMAKIACEWSDKVIFTSDNPRFENPETILDEMQQGVPAEHFKKTLRIGDRREALKAAVGMAQKGDIILVAGKGHETYQDIQGVKYPFDDRIVLEEMFQLLKK